MGGVILRRLAVAPLVLLLVSFLVFAVVVFLPGDPAQAIAGDRATAEQLAQVRATMHLDEPFPVRYGTWLGGVLHGDLGYSFASRRPVGDQIALRLPVTLELALGALVVALAVGIPGGIVTSLFPRPWLDRALLVGTTLGLAVPSFWLGTILVVLFAVNLHWLPATGFTAFGDNPGEWLRHLVLPVLALGLYPGAELARQLRVTVVTIAEEPYIRTIWAKGVGAPVVFGKHVLKNAATPALTILGLRVGYLLAGSAVIESVFSLPGMGKYSVEAIANRDIPSIQGVILVAATLILATNLVVDVLNAWLNPRVRLA